MRDGMADRLRHVHETIEAFTEPGDAIYCHHACPIFYFLSDRPHSTRYSEPCYYGGNEEIQKRMVEDLEKHKPKVAVFKDVLIAGWGTLDHQRVLFPYFKRHYELVTRVGSFRVCRRID